MKKLTVNIFLLLSFQLIYAQTENWTFWGDELRQITNNLVYVDRKGMVWAGGGDGDVGRYDGENWTYWKITEGDISGIAADYQNNVWISNESKLFKYDGNNFTYISDNGRVHTMVIDSRGNLWGGSFHYGLSKFDGETWASYDTLNSDIPGNHVYGLEIDSEDNIWGMAQAYGSSSYKLFKFDGNSYQNFEMIDRISFQQSLAFDSRGNIVAATPSGLMIYDGTRWNHHISPDPKIGYYLNSVAIDNNDNIWCAFDYGLAKFKDEKWILYDSLNTFIQSLDGFIFSLDIDSADNKWMSVYSGGIISFNVSDIGVHVEIEKENIDKYKLNQSYPNPFNSYTIISYTLPEDQHVELKVYDILGNLVTELVNENVSTGYHVVSFNASGLSSGMYFYTIKTERFFETKKIALVK